MFTAYSKRTGELVNSVNIGFDPKYPVPEEEEFYADPNQIENINQELVPNIKEIVATFIKEQKYFNYKGTLILRSPHFRIPNAEKLGINVIPESEEHRFAKEFIYNEAKNKQLQLLISSITKPEQHDNIIPITSFDIDYSRIGIEVTEQESGKRADIILPLKEWNSFIGFGFVIEIQFSYQSEETKIKRSLNWLLKGFSIIWLNKLDFEKEEPILKNNKVKLCTFQEQAKEFIDSEINKLNERLRNTFTNIYFKENEIYKRIEEKLALPEYGGHCPICYEEHQGIKVLKTIKGQKFYSCSRWPVCKGY